MRKNVVRVPQVMQMESEECGAACLDMICWYYKKWLPLEQVRLDCGVSRDGSSALNLVKTARQYGFETKSISCDVEYLKTEVAFPAIIHWGFNHFVVLAGFLRDRAVLNDPVRGRILVTLEELDRSFTGVCMEFSPSAEFKTQGKKPSVNRFITCRLSQLKRSFLFVIVAAFLSGITAVASPAFYRYFLDKVLGGGMKYCTPFIFAFSLFSLFQLVASLLDESSIRRCKGKLTILSDVAFIWHALCLPLEFFSQRYSVDIANRQNENEQVSATIIDQLVPMGMNILLSVIYIILMFQYSVKLGLVVLAASVLNLLSSRIATTSRVNYANSMLTEQSKLSSTMVSGINIIDTIKASGAENGFFASWAGLLGNVTKLKAESGRREALIRSIPSLVHRLTDIVILSLGAQMLIRGEFTTGMLMAFQSFLSQFMTPLEELLGNSQQLQETMTSVARISDVMDYPEDPLLASTPGDKDLTRLSGDVDIKGLTFGYSRMQPPLMENLDLAIAKGKQIALVGPTGSGKTTLVKLILGLYQPWEGDVLFDGKRRDAYAREVLTSSIAVVDQDRKVFEGTLMDNLKMWDSTIDDSVIIKACRDAMIHEEIMLRTGGYGCLMAEGGKNFSGGQLQRFEIARVLSLEPSIVVLDEATSALDADTEYQVMQNIRARGATVLVVSHRLSAIRDSDEIVVLDQGKIVERGSHEQLFKSGGLYSHLVTLE